MSRPDPFERLMNDLRAQAAGGQPPSFGNATTNAKSPTRDTAAGKPVTQADIGRIYAAIRSFGKTAEYCDSLIGDMVVVFEKKAIAQGNKIAALEEAICPRVASRLQSLEKAVASLQAAAATKAPAPAPTDKCEFLVEGVWYTMQEARIAAVIAGVGYRPHPRDYGRARQIINLIRGS